MRHLNKAAGVFALLLTLLVLPTDRASAQDYVVICDQFGSGFFFIPGTNECVSADLILENAERLDALDELFGPTGEITSRLRELDDEIDEAKEGNAIGIALANPFMPDGKTFAVGTNVGLSDGESAVGMTGIAQVTETFGVSGGFGVGLGHGGLAGRLGFQAAW
jgi:hypothetical protein